MSHVCFEFLRCNVRVQIILTARTYARFSSISYTYTINTPRASRVRATRCGACIDKTPRSFLRSAVMRFFLVGRRNRRGLWGMGSTRLCKTYHTCMFKIALSAHGSVLPRPPLLFTSIHFLDWVCAVCAVVLVQVNPWVSVQTVFVSALCWLVLLRGNTAVVYNCYLGTIHFCSTGGPALTTWQLINKLAGSTTSIYEMIQDGEPRTRKPDRKAV